MSAAPRDGRPGVSTRERLIATTADLIHQNNYNDVGVALICDHAGVKRGSFYHFFESKEALALAALDEQWEAHKRDHIEPCFDDDLAPADRVLAMFATAHESHTSLSAARGQTPGCPFGNLGAEMSASSDLIRSRIGQIFEEWAAFFETALREALARDEIDPTIDPGSTAWMLVAALQGSILIAKVMKDTSHILRAGRDCVHAIWGGEE